MTHPPKISVAELCSSDTETDMTPIHLTPFPNSVEEVIRILTFSIIIFILHLVTPIKLWKGGGGK